MIGNKVVPLISKMKELYEYAISIHEEDFVKEMLSEMFLVSRLEQDYLEFESPILELLANYEMSQFQVAGISFYSQLDWIYGGDFIYIGSDGCGDFLCLHKETDAIYDFADQIDYNKVSENSLTFFEHLLLISKYNFSKASSQKIDKNVLLDQVAINQYSRKFFSNMLE